MDKIAFKKACESEKMQKGIGTLSEKTLHSVLKNYFEPHPENHEIKIGNFVADIVGENGIFEIQTANFYNMKKKLTAFLEVCDVTIVYPIPQIKWIYTIDEASGEIISKRKSPKKGSAVEIFSELVNIREFLLEERLKFKICLLEIIEYRSADKKTKWGRGLRKERVPLEIIDEIDIFTKADYLQFLPQNLPETFTSKDFARLGKFNLHSAQLILNVLNSVGVVKRVGKKGNAFQYKIS